MRLILHPCVQDPSTLLNGAAGSYVAGNIFYDAFMPDMGPELERSMPWAARRWPCSYVK